MPKRSKTRGARRLKTNMAKKNQTQEERERRLKTHMSKRIKHKKREREREMPFKFGKAPKVQGKMSYSSSDQDGNRLSFFTHRIYSMRH